MTGGGNSGRSTQDSLGGHQFCIPHQGGNPVKLPTRLTTPPNYRPPPLSTIIKILGAPKRRDDAPFPADAYQNDDSEVLFQINRTDPTDGNVGHVDGGIGRHKHH